MLPLLVECRHIIEVYKNAVDSNADKTRCAHLLKNMQMLTLPVPDDRGEQHQFAAFGLRQHGIDHLTHGLRLECYTVFWAARVTNSGEQKPQVVINFGDGTDRRARVMGGRFLFN